jgi:hypothetical protein
LGRELYATACLLSGNSPGYVENPARGDAMRTANPWVVVLLAVELDVLAAAVVDTSIDT